jgi:ferredoxin
MGQQCLNCRVRLDIASALDDVHEIREQAQFVATVIAEAVNRLILQSSCLHCMDLADEIAASQVFTVWDLAEEYARWEIEARGKR